jgi:hypothetical protein
VPRPTPWPCGRTRKGACAVPLGGFLRVWHRGRARVGVPCPCVRVCVCPAALTRRGLLQAYRLRCESNLRSSMAVETLLATVNHDCRRPSSRQRLSRGSFSTESGWVMEVGRRGSSMGGHRTSFSTRGGDFSGSSRTVNSLGGSGGLGALPARRSIAEVGSRACILTVQPSFQFRSPSRARASPKWQTVCSPTRGSARWQL